MKKLSNKVIELLKKNPFFDIIDLSEQLNLPVSKFRVLYRILEFMEKNKILKKVINSKQSYQLI